MTRPLLLLLGVAAAATLAACGGSNDPASSASRQDKAFDGALKFAKCMRDHGIDMPDPTRTANGGILQKMGGPGGKERGTGPGPEDPKMKAAQQACGKYLDQGGGRAPDPAQQAKARDAFVAYARCMRSKGINMPDPKVSGHGISMMLGRGVNPNSPAFKAADQACHKLLADIEKGGPMVQGRSGGPS